MSTWSFLLQHQGLWAPASGLLQRFFEIQAVGLSSVILLWLLINKGLHPLQSSLKAKAKQSSRLFIPHFLSRAAVGAVSPGAEASCVPEHRPEDSPLGTAGPPESLGVVPRSPVTTQSQPPRTAALRGRCVTSCDGEAEPQSSQCQCASPGQGRTCGPEVAAQLPHLKAFHYPFYTCLGW